jgi:DNA polymerase-3 subunit beta
MKLKIERDELQRGLSRVQAIVERRGTLLPILANVLIQASDDTITLAATDLEVGVLARHPADVARPGSITLAAKKFFEIVRELEDKEIRLTLEDGSRVTIECGPSRFTLMSISPDEYPAIPTADGVSFVTLESALVAEMIDRTLYCTSSEETRYNLNGVFMEQVDGRVRFVSTDGHRLAKIDKTPNRPVSFLEKGIIVPRKGVTEIRRLCDETEGNIEIGLGRDGFLMVRRPDLLLTSRLIDGEFPNYRQILPDDYRVRLVLDRERLLHAVRRISVLAPERTHGFRVRIVEGELQLHVSNPDLGEARESVPTTYAGDPLETGFNARYVLDSLGAMSAKEVIIELTDELAPAVFRPADDPDQLAVIMPMRL